MSRLRHVWIGFTVFVIVFGLSVGYRLWDGNAVNDLWFPFCGARALLNHIDPYGGACVIQFQGRIYPPNPLTTILAVMPFTIFGGLGEITFWSLLCAVLVFGILESGETWRLLVFASAPFWECFHSLQWGPLLLALAFLPGLLPLALVKPHVGLPLLLTRLNRRRLLLCLAFVALAFLVQPNWLFEWLPQTGVYDGYIPLLIFPPLALLLLFWRNKNARLLLLFTLVPQREMYDALPLSATASKWGHLALWCACSWLGLAAVKLAGVSFGYAVVFTCYLPLAGALAFENRKELYWWRQKILPSLGGTRDQGSGINAKNFRAEDGAAAAETENPS